MKRMAILISFLFLASVLYAQKPKVTWNGLFYIYNFAYRNTDFTSVTPDGNSYMYMHGDISATADFGNGVTAYMSIGAWGQHGMSPYHAGGLGENIDPRADIMQAYFTINNIFDSPFSFRIGKERLLYGDGAIMFDGGEDGAAGAKLMYRSTMVDADLFYYRYAQFGGIANVGYVPDIYPGNWNIIGLYPTVKLMEGKVKLYPYYVMRQIHLAKNKADAPTWIGLRFEGSPLPGLDLVAEFTQMGGKNDTTDISYKGKHLRFGATYTLPAMPLSLGVGYVSFSGDDETTAKDNERYETVTQGPYTYGFYKDWPGFGPAHLMTTGYAFAGVDPWNVTMHNLNMINANLAYTVGALTLRGDLFIYQRNWVPSGVNDAMGNEIALMMKYDYKNTITIGLTGGVWMPGDYQKSLIEIPGSTAKAESVKGGYLWLAKSF